MKTSDIEVKYIDHQGTDLSIVNSARVSFNKKSKWESEDGFRKLSEKDEKLIKYLAKHKHTSPFNHTFLTMYVKAPVFVARQLVKHKFMPWNEVSRRYVDDEPEFYIPKHSWRLKAENVKQGSSDGYVDEDTSVYIQRDVEQTTRIALQTYQFMISQNVAAEQARVILPQNMMTEWYWSGTLGAFADMLRLRLSPYTQKETREVAEKIEAFIGNLFPVALPALLDDPFEGKVAISEELLKTYQDDSWFLTHLRNRGVADWEVYEEAWFDFKGDQS